MRGGDGQATLKSSVDKRSLPPIRLLACLVGFALLASVGACGDETDEEAGTFEEPARLTPAEVRTVRSAQEAVRVYCAAKLRALATGATVPPEPLSRARSAVGRLGDLAEAKPEAEVGDGASVRLALGDIAEDLEGTNCDQDLVELIEARLAALPPP